MTGKEDNDNGEEDAGQGYFLLLTQTPGQARYSNRDKYELRWTIPADFSRCRKIDDYKMILKNKDDTLEFQNCD